jgi:glycogen debranching enzyme
MIELHGKQFVPAPQTDRERWSEAIEQQHKPTFTLKENDIFAIVDRLGNMVVDRTGNEQFVTGLFCQDTRFLSRSELQIEGRSPILLSSVAETGFSLSVAASNPPLGDRIAAYSIEILRDLVIRGGLFETIEICNYNPDPVRFSVSLSFEADFVDVFEVRGYKDRPQRGQFLQRDRLACDRLEFAYLGVDGVLMESRLRFSDRQPDEFCGSTAIWHLDLAPRETQKLSYCLQPHTDNEPSSQVPIPTTLDRARDAAKREHEQWSATIARYQTDRSIVNEAIAQTEDDIYLLRQSFGDRRVLVAGIPWFSALFGRDSLIAAAQTLSLDPTLARDTLFLLAEYQGKTDDEWREAQPGKILHELRFGELARCHEIPHTPYYGTVDATPLWLMLYADYYAWTGDRATIERLWPNALAAMDWIDRESAKTGYLTYFRHSPGGIDNQGWKDSGDCIVDRHGHLARGPIALCEVQGYVYAAKQRLSRIARRLDREDLGDRWQAEARDLRERFNRDFWLAHEDYCALALDGNGQPVDSITSNPGHCLHLGIFTPERALKVARRIVAPDLFSGWGVRTLSSAAAAYNPMGYHLGSVWPHDNSLIAIGLRSLGLSREAYQIFEGLFEMTVKQPHHRLPELICGYKRSGEKGPVRYPVACSPQAWAAGSLFHLLQAAVNPIPDAEAQCLRIVKPMLPPSLDRLVVRDLKVGGARLDLEFDRIGETTACRVTEQVGSVQVIIEV